MSIDSKAVCMGGELPCFYLAKTNIQQKHPLVALLYGMQACMLVPMLPVTLSRSVGLLYGGRF